ncbi:hypothetical protein CH272_10225 [Rhodococcus sp. 05-340-1]|nr:hypothetical protein CH271_10685 [Rhodococcus sp. 05-340-2]OZD80090.1 hypothetical protein CH272_10225 [Rhodococcus sp. 05-340-1]OZF30744.1 hypothetical protein CH295_16920 [Rhodococcus sp. 14-2483-1-2]
MQQSSRFCAEFSAFGQTEWSMQDQATFAAGLSCIPDTAPVVEMTNSVAPGVAIVAQANSGSFIDATAMLDAVGAWLESHSTQVPAGHCLQDPMTSGPARVASGVSVNRPPRKALL